MHLLWLCCIKIEKAVAPKIDNIEYNIKKKKIHSAPVKACDFLKLIN